MNKLVAFCFFCIPLILSCNFNKTCNEITDDDVVGIYYSLNEKNRNKQYIQLLEDGRFYNIYCDSKIIIKDWGTWDRNSCEIYIKGMRCFNTPMWDTTIHNSLSYYRWKNGKLFLGEDDVSYKKTRNKPKLNCEK